MINKYLIYLNESITNKYYFHASFRLLKGKLETSTELKNTDGNSIYDWLMEDAGLAFYESTKKYGKKIPGDHNILYLCLADRSGKVEYKNLTTKKNFHWMWLLKSNPDKIKKLIDFMYSDHVFNVKQYRNLIKQIEFSKSTRIYKINFL